MSVESRAGLGILLFAALVIALAVDTFPRKYRGHGLSAFCGLALVVWWALCH